MVPGFMTICPLFNNSVGRVLRHVVSCSFERVRVVIPWLVISSTALASSSSWSGPVGGISTFPLIVRSLTETYRLVPGQVQTRKIAGAATHIYKVKLEARQAFVAKVGQNGIDLALTITAPNKTVVAYADSPNGAFGYEEILVVADLSGEYLLEIKPFDADISTGSYTIT